MKKLLVFMGFLAFLASPQMSKSQITTPQPSAKAKAETTVGLTEISISYYRPSVKGRAIFGEGNDYLQPYGQLWRAGANSGSVLSLSTEAVIAGKKVQAGDYLIFMTPGKDQWEFKLYSDLSVGGNVGRYNIEDEVLSVSVTPKKLSEPVETLTYQISDISEKSTSANLHFMWENYSIKIPIEVDYDAVVMAQIEKETKVSPANLIAAANYYYNNDKDLRQALEWVNTYLSIENNSQQFWNLHLKAKILAELGEKVAAKEVALKSMKLAQENKGGDFGYVKRNQELIDNLK